MAQTVGYAYIADNGLKTYKFNEIETAQACRSIKEKCSHDEMMERLKSVAYLIGLVVVGALLFETISWLFSSTSLIVGTLTVGYTIYEFCELSPVLNFLVAPFSKVAFHWQRADHYKLQAEMAFQRELMLISPKKVK